MGKDDSEPRNVRFEGMSVIRRCEIVHYKLNQFARTNSERLSVQDNGTLRIESTTHRPCRAVGTGGLWSHLFSSRKSLL